MGIFTAGQNIDEPGVSVTLTKLDDELKCIMTCKQIAQGIKSFNYDEVIRA